MWDYALRSSWAKSSTHQAENLRLSNKETNLLYTLMLILVQPETASVLSHWRGVFNILFIYFTYSNITKEMKHHDGWNINEAYGQIKKSFKQIEQNELNL